MTKVLRVPYYLEHILKAIERIERYTDDMDEVAFLGTELVQDAVIRNIEIIGEASNNIQRVDAEFAARHAARGHSLAGHVYDAQPHLPRLRQGGSGNRLEDDRE